METSYPEGPGFVMPRGYTKQEALDSVGPGWAALIEALWAFIDAGEGWYGSQKDTPVTVTQVKEKFGTLRFYFHGGDQFFRGAVGVAEWVSGRICEACGKPGTTGPAREGGMYIVTFCDECRAKAADRRVIDVLDEFRNVDRCVAHGNLAPCAICEEMFGDSPV